MDRKVRNHRPAPENDWRHHGDTDRQSDDDVDLPCPRPEPSEQVRAEQGAIGQRCDGERELHHGGVLIAQRHRARHEHRSPQEGQPATGAQQVLRIRLSRQRRIEIVRGRRGE